MGRAKRSALHGRRPGRPSFSLGAFFQLSYILQGGVGRSIHTNAHTQGFIVEMPTPSLALGVAIIGLGVEVGVGTSSLVSYKQRTVHVNYSRYFNSILCIYNIGLGSGLSISGDCI